MKYIYFVICAIFYEPCSASAIATCKTFSELELAAATSYLAQPRRDIIRSPFDAQAYIWSILAVRDFDSAVTLQIDIREHIDRASPASGLTPLALAALCHDLSAVKKLLLLEANIEARQGNVETPWGDIESPSPILLAILGPNFVSDENNETVAYLIKMKANYSDAMRRIKAEFPLSNAAKAAQMRNK